MGREQDRVMVPMQVIAHIQTDFPQKFGIPCQSGMVPSAQGRIVFEPEFACNSAGRGLDGFSHLWILWQFENGRPGGSAADLAADVDDLYVGAVDQLHHSPKRIGHQSDVLFVAVFQQ